MHLILKFLGLNVRALILYDRNVCHIHKFKTLYEEKLLCYNRQTLTKVKSSIQLKITEASRLVIFQI